MLGWYLAPSRRLVRPLSMEGAARPRFRDIGVVLATIRGDRHTPSEDAADRAASAHAHSCTDPECVRDGLNEPRVGVSGTLRVDELALGAWVQGQPPTQDHAEHASIGMQIRVTHSCAEEDDGIVEERSPVRVGGALEDLRQVGELLSMPGVDALYGSKRLTSGRVVVGGIVVVVRARDVGYAVCGTELSGRNS